MKIKIISGSLLIIGAIAALIYLSGRKERMIEAETLPFVEETVEDITHGWNAEKLVSRAEPDLIKAMTSHGQSLYDLFAIYRTLGRVKSDPDCHIKDTSQFYGSSNSYITATYNCEVEFAKGPATVMLVVRRAEHSKDWKVYYINIASPYFTEEGYNRTK